MDTMDRDPALEAALRGLDGPAPAVDWDALRGRVAAAAELPLARRRRAPRRPGVRVLVPLAAAAAVAGLALGTPYGGGARPLPEQEQRVVEQILAESLPDQVGALLSGEAADQALLEAVSDG
ncbi:MAG TPA: hypothetical protein VFQ45_18745 [Longimicrobium sp.]|nr:hypothetical protein [Longimicrobium sp.]